MNEKTLIQNIKQAKQPENTTSTEVEEIMSTDERKRWVIQHLEGWTKDVRVDALWSEKKVQLIIFFFFTCLYKRGIIFELVTSASLD